MSEPCYLAAANIGYMKHPVFLLLFLCGLFPLAAQTFHPIPEALLEQEVAFEQANECFIYFDNPSGDTLQLRWRRFEVSVPEGWVIDICDYGLCYAGIPPNGTMNPVHDTIRPYLKLVVQPGVTAGSAWLWFRVFEKDNDTNFADVYFSLHTPGTTSIPETKQPSYRVFPNPAFDVLFVENTGKGRDGGWPSIINHAGQAVWSRPLGQGEQQSIDISTWPSGIYYLKQERLVQKILVYK